LIEELKKDNVTEIYLWCEKELEAFYKKLGFEKTGYIYSETEF
jgi:predicted GNAT family N-acyltransferase